MKKLLLISVIGFTLAGCSVENQNRNVYQFSCGGSYSAGDSTVSVENLIHSMDFAIKILAMQNTGYKAGVRLDYSNYSKGMVCNNEYTKSADENIKDLTSKVKKKVKGAENKKLVADAYSKWLTYMESITPNDNKGDSQAMHDYQLSINKLKAISL